MSSLISDSWDTKYGNFLEKKVRLEQHIHERTCGALEFYLLLLKIQILPCTHIEKFKKYT